MDLTPLGYPLSGMCLLSLVRVRGVFDVPDAPNARTDGGWGSGVWCVVIRFWVFLLVCLVCIGTTAGGFGHLDEIRSDDGVVQSCWGFCSVPGPLQSVQRAEFWEIILGVDNLNVVRHVGRLLDGGWNPCLAELIKDGEG